MVTMQQRACADGESVYACRTYIHNNNWKWHQPLKCHHRASASITDLDTFTLVTSGNTDSVTALTVTLTGANSFQSLSEVRVTDSTGSTTYFSASTNPASNTVSFSGGTPIP